MSLFANLCTHETTTEADEDGQALCTTCGTPVQVRLTEALLMRTFEQVWRDHGPLGRHSMRCVETPAGWCCADDCTISR